MEHFTITRADDPGKSFTSRINPISLKSELRIDYGSKRAAGGTAGAGNRLGAVRGETLAVKLVLDATLAATEGSGETTAVPVDDQLASLRTVVERGAGETDEAPALKLVLGEFGFQGRLKKMTPQHTAFTKEGVPLRVDVELLFASLADGAAAAQASTSES